MLFPKCLYLKCKSVPNNNGVQTNELEFTLVDEPVIMATQVKQVFYVTNPADLSRRWSIILKGKHIPHSDDESFDILSIPSYAT